MSGRGGGPGGPERDAAYWAALGEALSGGVGNGGGLDRRRFLELAGAGMALAGVAGCTEPPPEYVLPYAKEPPEVTPGIPRSFATSITLDGFAVGLLAQTREGRPIKLEGNPDHPASLGGTGVWEQASLLSLYDPDRADAILEDDLVRGWEDVRGRFSPEGLPERGRGVRILMEPTTSPTRLALLRRVRERLPEARVTSYAPTGTLHLEEATRRVFGRPLLPVFDLEGVGTVVAVESDFTHAPPLRHRYARHFAATRKLEGPEGDMSRFYAAESAPTPTGSLADHTLPVRPSTVVPLLAALAEEVGAEGPLGSLPPEIRLEGREREWARFAARDLADRPGGGLLVVGEHLPPAAHALAHLVNETVGAGRRRVRWIPSLYGGDLVEGPDLSELAEELRAGEVEALVVVGGNPAYTAAADLGLPEAVGRAGTSLYLGPYRNETAEACRWFVPETHWLETWGDARAADGTLSTVQPAIRPLRPGRSPEELLGVLAGEAPMEPRERVRSHWRRELHPRYGSGDAFEAFWRETLRRGLVPESAPDPVPSPSVTGDLATWLWETESSPRDTIEIRFRRDARVHDGRFANNSWLQELPDPVTSQAWGNAALMASPTAERLGVTPGDLIHVERGGAAARIPVLEVPGHADGVVTLPLGYGRRGAERVAREVGVNVYPLRTWEDARPGSEGRPVTAEVSPALGEEGEPLHEALAIVQNEMRMHDRHPVLHHTLEYFRAHPGFARDHRGHVETLYSPMDFVAEHQWAMTLDLNACTGCGACVVACQAENNIPVVGKEEVRKGREMHWLRVDRYVHGDRSDPEVFNQPVPCMQCEKAPCEYVCPVYATTHSADGLNEMTYNRCVGTRFCSNNCPYKVRRFNWFDYNSDRPDSELPVLNPDVTVRERGVMEKCTYCVQRIRRAEIQARAEGVDLREEDVVTACQQACPLEVITFGSIADPHSAVSATRENPRQYALLHHLGTKPRTRYLARITNPNPRLGEGGDP